MANFFTRALATLAYKVNPQWAVMASYSDNPQAIRMNKSYKTFVKQGYKDSDTVYKCISYIIRNGAAIPPILYTDTTRQKRIDSHALLDKLNKPNPEQSGVAYREAVLGYKLLAGNSFQYAIRARNGPPDELWALRPDRVEINIVPRRGIVGYHYQDLDDPILPENIGHTKYWNPDDDQERGMGMSPLEAAALNIDMQVDGKKWNLGLLQNGARPPGIWRVPTIMGGKERQALEDKLHEKMMGARNAGKSPLFDGGLDWKPTGLPPAQMDWLDSLKFNGGSIANILNMAPQLVGDTSSTTYDNMEQAKIWSYTEGVFPELDDLYALWNVWLVPMYPDLVSSGAWLYYDKESVEVIQKLIQAQKDAQSDRGNKLWMSGLAMQDEARQLAGLPPLTNGTGKIFRIGAILVPADRLGDYANQSLSTPAAPPSAMPEPLQLPASGQTKPGEDDTLDESKRILARLEQKIKEIKEASGDEEHTGIMIALFLDETIASKLALPGGEPADDLHITLAYLGDKSEAGIDTPALKKLIASCATKAQPLSGTTSGVARFASSDSSDGLDPVVALVNVAGLQAWRSELVKQLDEAEISVASNFEYTPHITLAYVDSDDAMPIDSVPSLDLSFNQIWLCIGDDRFAFPIGKETQKRLALLSSRRYTKALDLETIEEKQAYMKSVEAGRERWYTKAEQRFQGYFDDEKAAVVKAINAAALPASAYDRAEYAVNSKGDDLKEVLSKLYQDIALDIGKETLRQLKGSARHYSTKDAVQDFIDLFGPDVLVYLLSMSAQKIKDIQETTRAEIQSALSDGVAAGEGIPQLAKRVDDLYAIRTPERCRTIARTETVSASNFAAVEAAKSSGLTLNKVWLATGDSKTRPDHADADGQEVGMDEKFIVGGVEMDRPGDGPADQVVNCRCTVYFKRVKSQGNDDTNADKKGFVPLKGEAGRELYREFARRILV